MKPRIIAKDDTAVLIQLNEHWGQVYEEGKLSPPGSLGSWLAHRYWEPYHAWISDELVTELATQEELDILDAEMQKAYPTWEDGGENG